MPANAAQEKRFDTIIRNGKIVDGTLMPAFIGDVAIKDGKIAQIGFVTGSADREIDATGLVVAPGVIDIHTHYDAQLSWDPYASQSCWHGVTTVIISCCGFGFAPCRPQDNERAMQRMTRVEAIPYAAMKDHMKWDWESQDEYFRSLERHGIGVNVAGYIPQTPIRAYVMGADDGSRKQATSEEIEQMKELVRDGYRAGALGLSTDFNLIDRDYDGRPLPSVVAPIEETEALVAVAKEFNVGSIQITPQALDIDTPEMDMLKRMAELSGRPVVYNALNPVNHNPTAWQRALSLLEEANQTHRIYGLGVSHRVEHVFNLLEYNLFDDMPAWNTALACPLEQRIANLKDPHVRETLQHDLDYHLNRLWSGKWDRMKVFESRNKAYEGRYLDEIARSEGKSPLDVFCDLNVAENLTATFLSEDIAGDDDNAVETIMKHPYALPGLSDGGAHTLFISLGKYPTLILSKWVRDEKKISLEEAHWRMSYMSAAAIGLEGVGTLQPGMPADIIVYDLDRLEVTPEDPVYEDIVSGGRRLAQRARGYRAILINGVPTFENDECTGALPGRVLRSSAYVPAQALEAAE